MKKRHTPCRLRRQLLIHGSQLSLLALLGMPRAHAAEAACVDHDNLSSNEAALRQSLEYTDAAADEKKACGGCSFFTSGAGHCGACSLLSGPVDAKGHCISWSARS